MKFLLCDYVENRKVGILRNIQSLKHHENLENQICDISVKITAITV